MRGSRPHTPCGGQATIPFSRGNDTCSSVNHTEEPQRRQPLGQAALGALIARPTSGGPPQRSGVEQRQLPQTTDSVPSGQCVLRHRYELRNPGLPETGAHTRGGRQIARRPFGRTVAADANDTLYQWDASGDYNPSPGLELIEPALLAINSADDERNPPETGIMERELKRAKNGKLYMIPASEETRGHGTTCMAKFWKDQLQEFVTTAPRRPFMPGPQSAMHQSKAA